MFIPGPHAAPSKPEAQGPLLGAFCDVNSQFFLGSLQLYSKTIVFWRSAHQCVAIKQTFVGVNLHILLRF